ncbi:hypothetical protein ACKGJI_00720 [Sulfurospirillum sp. 1307]|jgi:predicted transcriptional regulator
MVKQEKLTIILPHDLKTEIVELKKKFKTSINSIVNKAIEEYVKKNEVDRWIKGAEKAAKNSDYKNEALNMDVGDDFYEH